MFLRPLRLPFLQRVSLSLFLIFPVFRSCPPPSLQVDYIDIPKRTLLSVPGYEDLVEFGVLTSFAYPLEDGSGGWLSCNGPGRGKSWTGCQSVGRCGVCEWRTSPFIPFANPLDDGSGGWLT